MNKISAIPLLLLFGSTAFGQVLDSSGNPDTSYPGFYAWFDASDGVNGSGQPNDGDSATMWVDNTGNGHDLIRASGDVTRQPVFRATAANGAPALEFDGNDFIWANQTTEFGEIAGAKTMFIVAEVDTTEVNSYIFDSCTGAGRNALLTGQQATPDQWQIWTGTGLAGANGTPINRDVFEIHTLMIDAGLQEHAIGGAMQYTGAEGAQALKGFLLGSRYTTSDALAGHIAEVLVYDENLSSTNRSDLEGYLDGKYNGLPPGPNLDVTNLVAGMTTTVEASNCTALGSVYLAYSVRGGGPTTTPFGDAMVSRPYTVIHLTADGNGDASFSAMVPAAATGASVWLHALDLGAATFTNPLALTIG